jgi:hypothetical protein
VFYDLGIKLKLIINGVKLLPKIIFFIKCHFFMTLTPLLENVRPNKRQTQKLRSTKNKN